MSMRVETGGAAAAARAHRDLTAAVALEKAQPSSDDKDEVQIRSLPLPPDDRPSRDKWVARMFRVVNRDLAKAKPERLESKRQAMLANFYAYFRGAATAFYLDLEKHDPPAADEPCVASSADNHKDNFGSYQSIKKNVVYDVNDFDEAVDSFAFSRDIMRNMTSWVLDARLEGKSEEKQTQIARAFMEGYTQQMEEFGKHGGAGTFTLTSKNAKGAVKDLLTRMEGTDAANKWMSKVTTKAADNTLQFVPSTEVIPHPYLLDAVLHVYPSMAADRPSAVAVKMDSGVASRGLDPRLYVAENPSRGTPRVLEMKQEIRSALEGIPHVLVNVTGSRAEQVAKAASTLVAEPYPQLGSFTVAPWILSATPPDDGKDASYLVRERPALKGAVDTSGMKTADMAEVARQQGQLMAAMHARQPNRTRDILAFLKAHPTFAEERIKAAMKAADRQQRDFEAFKKMTA